MCNVPLWQMQDNVLANPWQSEKKYPVDISNTELPPLACRGSKGRSPLASLGTAQRLSPVQSGLPLSLRCEVSDNHVPYPALYSFLRLACSIHPSASAFLLYFPVISVFLFLDLFPFLLKDIKIAVINISPIHNV